jgi:hypothetical protein
VRREIMTTKTVESIDRAADYFVNYLFDEYNGTRHVRRCATWIGMLLLAVNRVSRGTLARSRTRQMVFKYRRRRFKVKYDHKAGTRGGIVFVSILPGQGSPEGEPVITVTNLKEAERVYRRLGKILDAFIDGEE